MPKIDDTNRNLDDGSLFYYADSKNPQWQTSAKPIGDADSAIGQTVAQLYGAKRSNVSILIE